MVMNQGLNLTNSGFPLLDPSNDPHHLRLTAAFSSNYHSSIFAFQEIVMSRIVPKYFNFFDERRGISLIERTRY